MNRACIPSPRRTLPAIVFLILLLRARPAAAQYARVFAGNGVGTNILVSDDQTSAGFQLRPSLLIGYDAGPWQFGAELAYAYAWLDSDQLGNHLQQFQAGVFVRLTY